MRVLNMDKIKRFDFSWGLNLFNLKFITMKKIAFLMIALMLPTVAFATPQKKEFGQETMKSIDTVYHDIKGAVETVYSDGKEVISTLYPEVKNAVVSIAKAIGVAAEHVYTVLVKNYVVIGVKWLILFLIGAGLVIFGGIVLYRSKSPITYRSAILLLMVVFGTIILFKIDYDSMLMGLINPEYGAINYILEVSKDLIK